jgi:hypothetical protein
LIGKKNGKNLQGINRNRKNLFEKFKGIKGGNNEKKLNKKNYYEPILNSKTTTEEETFRIFGNLEEIILLSEEILQQFENDKEIYLKLENSIESTFMKYYLNNQYQVPFLKRIMIRNNSFKELLLVNLK